jgi:hypothetical protein
LFLIHGIRRIKLRGELLPGTCDHCGTEGSVQLLVVQPYVHLFWIPFFPLPKRARTECLACKHEVKHSRLGPMHIGLFDALKGEKRTPLWTWIGAGVMAFVLPWFITQLNRNSADQNALLLHPQVGDIWTIKLSDKRHTLHRVEEVRADSIFVRACDRVAVGGFMAQVKLSTDSTVRFDGDRTAHARADLADYDRGPLRSIERPSAKAR